MSPESYDRRTVLRFGTATLAALSTAGCIDQSSTIRFVTMPDGFTFDPEAATIETGDTVEWTNGSDVEHTVTAYEDELPDGATYFASGGFGSERAAKNDIDGGLLAPGETYEHTFERSGTYAYFCIPHEGSGMVGTVRVK